MSVDLLRPGLLVIAEQGIGDALTLLPSLRALRTARPDLRIELLAPGLYPLAANVRETVTILDHRPLAALAEEERLAWLRERGIRWIWNTERKQGQWSRALRESHNPDWFTAPIQRDWAARHVLDARFVQLRGLFPDLPGPGKLALPLTPVQESERQSFRSRFPPAHTLVAIHPGAGDPNRVWPAERFRALACILAEHPMVTVLFFLGDAEVHFSAPGYLPERVNVQWVSQPLDGAVPMLAGCDLFIGNDSGFYHLAFALGLKVVGIYRSPRRAQRWAYSSPRARAVFPWVPSPLRRDWTRWVSVKRVLTAARRVTQY